MGYRTQFRLSKLLILCVIGFPVFVAKETHATTEHEVQQGWRVLQSNTVFFAHQSVGENIVQGLQKLAQQNHKSVVWLRTQVPEQVVTPAFVHVKVGKNKKPLTKLEAFEHILESGMETKINIALVKFCYVDVQRDTNIDSLVTSYHSTLEKLEKQFPSITFIATTVPLTTRQTGPKAWMNKILGREVRGELENKLRNDFNQRVRALYGSGRRLFDIAAVESTHADGRLVRFTFKGKSYEALSPSFTNDGGHLNALGRRHVAQAFLKMLGRLQD